MRVLVPILLLMAGCQGSKPLPPPGASGTVVMHLWDERASQPTVVTADRIRQKGLRFEHLDLEPMRMRLALPDGEVLVEAPSASWARGPSLLDCPGPIRFGGVLRGQPLVGRARSGQIDTKARTLTLHDVDLVHAGARLSAPWARLGNGRNIEAERLQSRPAPPGIAAAVAALQ